MIAADGSIAAAHDCKVLEAVWPPLSQQLSRQAREALATQPASPFLSALDLSFLVVFNTCARTGERCAGPSLRVAARQQPPSHRRSALPSACGYYQLKRFAGGSAVDAAALAFIDEATLFRLTDTPARRLAHARRLLPVF